jgi:hypothetical protein
MLLLVFKADNDLLWTDRSVGILKCYLRPRISVKREIRGRYLGDYFPTDATGANSLQSKSTLTQYDGLGGGGNRGDLCSWEGRIF